MVAKLISVGANRQKALDRMHRALSEYIIRGIHTTIPVCRAIMKDPVFRQGGATTKYLEDFFERTPEGTLVRRARSPKRTRRRR